MFVEIKTGQNCGPLTMNIFGLQQLGDGVHMYFKVVAEETFDLTEGGKSLKGPLTSEGGKSLKGLLTSQKEVSH